MLADTLKLINQAEEKADNIIAKANQKVQEIEKTTYQTVEKIYADNEQAIANIINQLPTIEIPDTAAIKLDIPQNKIKLAVEYITQMITGD